jgi:hypothetical protein
MQPDTISMDAVRARQWGGSNARYHYHAGRDRQLSPHEEYRYGNDVLFEGVDHANPASAIATLLDQRAYAAGWYTPLVRAGLAEPGSRSVYVLPMRLEDVDACGGDEACDGSCEARTRALAASFGRDAR